VTKRSVEAIVDALNAAGVRYLIAGGLAVVAHGYVRFTADVDLILDLEPDMSPAPSTRWKRSVIGRVFRFHSRRSPMPPRGRSGCGSGT